MVMAFIVSLPDSSSRQNLAFCESDEDAEDDSDAGVELGAHEAVGNGIGDVLEVHRWPLIKTPFAITASKGWEGIVKPTADVGFVAVEVGACVVVCEGRGELKLSSPRRPVAVAPA